MKNGRQLILVVSILLTVGILSSCSGGSEAAPKEIPTKQATSTPQPTIPPSSTPTETPIPSPTPIPGQFLQRPAYLKVLFENTDWVWKEFSQIGAMMGTLDYNPSTRFNLVYGMDEETANDILLSGGFNIDPEERQDDEEFFFEFLSVLLNDFLPAPAREELLLFIAENQDPGTYESTIYGFDVYLSIQDDTAKNLHIFTLIVDEMVEE